MEGAYRNLLARSLTDHVTDTLAHFVSRLVGEGHRQNVLGSNPPIYHMSNAAGHSTCFTGACTRKDQHRTIECIDGLGLGGVKAG